MRILLALTFCFSAQAADDGRSVFDHTFPDKIPFPFEKLVKEISKKSQVHSALIPLGRSLQRKAGAPDVFLYPRVVLAVQGDQMFIGYNEKAKVLEVISYNETAGKFEFQVVHDYAEGLKPRVLYAQRASCVACHQNEAPIFSTGPWDETQANFKISTKLTEALGKKYQGVATKIPEDTAYFFDNATDRANMFSVHQQAWAELCTTLECRRRMFRLILDMRINRKAEIDAPAVNFEKRWLQVWPRGLAIPNPDIPNRSPLDMKQSLEQLLDVSSEFEPLNLRLPLETWTYSQENIVHLFSGLAFFLPFQDVSVLKGKDWTRAVNSMSAASLAAPFDRVKLLTELYRLVGFNYPQPKSDWGPRQVDQSSEFLKSIERKSQIGVFQRCASCHNNTIGVPANYLFGEVEDVKKKIVQCGERIYYRLAMWHLPMKERKISPMPPQSALEVREEDWEQSNELRLIEDYVRKVLNSEGTDLEALVKKNFNELRPCIAE